MATRPRTAKAPAATPDAEAPAAEVIEAIEVAVSATVAAMETETSDAAADKSSTLPVPAIAAPGPTETAALVEGAAAPEAKPNPIAKQHVETIMKNAEEFLSFSQGNMEAMMKCGQIWATGLQDLSKQMAATAQTTMDETVSAFKAISTAKSLKEAMDLQASLARAAVEKAMSGSGQFADASFKLAEQAMAPLTARMQLAAQKFTPAA